MGIIHDEVGRSARALSDMGSFVERAAHATNPSHSTIGRVGAAVAVAKLGGRLLPAGWRLFRRYPLGSTMAVGGAALVLYLARQARAPTSAIR